MRTQVAIIGAGPSGLLLSQLLYRYGIDSVVLERCTREHVESRVRAALLEQGTVNLLAQAGVAERLERESLIHSGFTLALDEQVQRIDLKALTGHGVTLYGQAEVTKDLAEARLANGGQLQYEALDVAVQELSDRGARLSYRHHGASHEIECDFIAGCDGFHGVSRRSVPRESMQIYERLHPFGWLGMLADVPPVSEELIYSNQARGFALCSMRSATRSRYYVQCTAQDRIEDWSDQRFWDELRARLPREYAQRLVTGPSLEKGIASIRSFVVEPMSFGRLFLVGDAAHIVPPVGAKGLNLAAADVRLLHHALVEFYANGRRTLLDEYSSRALARVWRAMRFSWWLTQLTHKFSEEPFAHKLQLAELEYLAQSPAASLALAENYVGAWHD